MGVLVDRFEEHEGKCYDIPVVLAGLNYVQAPCEVSLFTLVELCW